MFQNLKLEKCITNFILEHNVNHNSKVTIHMTENVSAIVAFLNWLINYVYVFLIESLLLLLQSLLNDHVACDGLQ